MGADHSSDVLPMLSDVYHHFDVAMRGYDRAQVDAYLSRLDADLRAMTAERDAVSARTADLAAQLASAQAQIESLRRQLSAATTEVTTENVDTRVVQLLETAKTDAAALRAAAETEVEVMRNGAADAAARTRAAAQTEAERITGEATARHAAADDQFRRRMGEIDGNKASVEAELAAARERTRTEEAQLTAEAERERARLDADAAAERERLDAASAATRGLAEEDFEITLRTRRTGEYERMRADREQSSADAKRMVAEATATANQLLENAHAEVRALKSLREESYAHLRAFHSHLGYSLEQSQATAPKDEEGTPADT